MITQPKYLWLDLETTGLDPAEDWILECAALVSDNHLCTLHMPEIPVVDCVLWQSEAALSRMCDYVREMHTQNGLLAEIPHATWNETRLEQTLVELIDNLTWSDGKPILAGATVHFDRGFIAQYLPEVERRLHHRHRDVSALKMARLDATGEPFTKAEAHRAMADVRESLGQAREIHRWMQRAHEVLAA